MNFLVANLQNVVAFSTNSALLENLPPIHLMMVTVQMVPVLLGDRWVIRSLLRGRRVVYRRKKSLIINAFMREFKFLSPLT